MNGRCDRCGGLLSREAVADGAKKHPGCADKHTAGADARPVTFYLPSEAVAELDRRRGAGRPGARSRSEALRGMLKPRAR